jgi:sRNA-binding carbon storage regulator CsrA
MKIITLKKNEAARIGDVSITFIRKCGVKGFELGIKAPQSKSIHREEFFMVLKKELDRFLKRRDKSDDE